MTAPTVVVIGDALLDVTARPATPARVGADVPADIRLGCGGQGANLAVRLARQGFEVALICGLGDDAAGSLVTDVMRAEGVRLNPVPVEATGSVVILLDEDGERSMLSRRSPFVAGIDVPTGTWTVVSGYCFIEADAAAFARSLADLESRRVVVGCTVPELSQGAWSAAVAAARPDLLVLNRDEAQALGPIDSLSPAAVVTASDVITCSVDGMRLTIAVPPGPPAADTTGAGDAFAAALVAGLMAVPWPPPGEALEAAVIMAVMVAGQVARAPGAQARVAAEARA
ncbi:MAG: PfkB family carbohydrate kinase [Candidatus Limnocylindria bacterium]